MCVYNISVEAILIAWSYLDLLIYKTVKLSQFMTKMVLAMNDVCIVSLIINDSKETQI